MKRGERIYSNEGIYPSQIHQIIPFQSASIYFMFGLNVNKENQQKVQNSHILNLPKMQGCYEKEKRIPKSYYDAPFFGEIGSKFAYVVIRIIPNNTTLMPKGFCI